MIKERRHQRIMDVLRREGAFDISSLSDVMPEVSRTTLRRDMAELAELGALRRTHGGAVLPDADILRIRSAEDTPQAGRDDPLAGLDAVVLPPVADAGGSVLRRRIARMGLPFIAESAPQPGGCYLGPDNFGAGRDLGRLAAERLGREALTVLLLGQPELENTRARAEGFEAGLLERLGGGVRMLRASCGGSFRKSLQLASDAFDTQERIDVVFGVNDQAALGGLEAAQRRGLSVAVFATGGEKDDFIEQVARLATTWGIAAFHPRQVGVTAVDAVVSALEGGALPEQIVTPYTLVTDETLTQFRARPATRRARPVSRVSRPWRIGFMPHYPSHDWYRGLGQAMRARAEDLGASLVTIPPHESIAAEVSRVRRAIAAAVEPRPGETIILGAGEATLHLASGLRKRAFETPQQITVVTNSLDVMERLEGAPAVQVLLTGGEYQASDRCLVGPSLGALFERIRADRAFLSVSGLSAAFGASELDERLALAASRLAEAARETIVLADHTVIGVDATHRFARIEAIDAVITDDGTLPPTRQELRSAGLEVIVAGGQEEEGAGPPEPSDPVLERD